MIAEEEARGKILEVVKPLAGRRVDLLEALGCFAARDLAARLSLPVFDNSAMDGYAVIASDCRSGNRLRVIGEQPAGEARQLRVTAGETIRIFTGAPMPQGADGVVMQEDVTRHGEEIVVNDEVDPGQFVRRRGCDLTEGQKILGKGERVRATTLALLASQGFSETEVGGEVRASIISTGDELIAAGKPLRAGQIYETNAILLQALLKKCGAVADSVQHCPDRRDALDAALKAAVRNPVLIITGGVSVGEHDLVQASLRSLGARIDIWRVAIKPGKPFLFGQIGECAVFGLPGNAVSTFMTFLRFVRPAILQMMGAAESELALPTIPAELDVDLMNDGDRAHYFRGRIESGKFKPVGRQESHALFGLSKSNAILRLRPGEKRERDARVEVETWD